MPRTAKSSAARRLPAGVVSPWITSRWRARRSFSAKLFANQMFSKAALSMSTAS